MADEQEDVTLEDVKNPPEPTEDEPKKQEEDKGAGAKEGDNPPKQSQSRAVNARFAEQRRQAEASAKEKADKENHEAFVQGKIQGVGGYNPFTKEKIENEADLRQYEIMKEANDEGKNPFEAYLKVEREERMAEAKRQAEQKKAEEDSVALGKRLISEFKTAHPDADFNVLYTENAKFKQLLEKGFTPNEAYDFLDIKPTPPVAPPPTPSSVQQGKVSGKSVKDMSDAEFKAYWDNL